MDLPKAEELAAIFKAGREHGIAKLELVGKAQDGGERPILKVEFAPRSVVDEINTRAPLPPDPMAVIRGELRRLDPNAEQPDILEAINNGARLVDVGNPDPTAPSTPVA